MWRAADFGMVWLCRGAVRGGQASTLHASAAVAYEFQATQHRRTHSFNQPPVSQQDSGGSMDSDVSAPDSSGIDDLMIDLEGSRNESWLSY